MQPDPDPSIIEALFRLLPTGTDTSLFEVAPAPQLVPSSAATLEQADEAFDDGQFDRAFEFYLRLTPSRKTISRMVSCVRTIGTDEARDKLLSIVDAAEDALFDSLAPAVATNLQNLRQAQSVSAASSSNTVLPPENTNPWMAFLAEHLVRGLRGSADSPGRRRDRQRHL